MGKGTILFADDEERMRKLVRDFLVADGFSVLEAEDGRAAVETFESHPEIVMVILDVMMPGLDGYKVLEKIKSIRDLPTMLLTAKGGEYDELLGFRLGVDEYIKKPFRPKILVARINALLARANKTAVSDVLSSSGIELNRTAHTVRVLDSPVELTAKEFELLEYFLINKNLVCSRESIINNVWNFDFDGDERTVDTHVKKLRSKLGQMGGLIKTVWAVGYKFEEG